MDAPPINLHDLLIARNAAAKTDNLFLDSNEIVAEAYERLGPAKVNAFFADARTRTNAVGAEFILGGGPELNDRKNSGASENGFRHSWFKDNSALLDHNFG